jgi:hypothetical protein
MERPIGENGSDGAEILIDVDGGGDGGRVKSGVCAFLTRYQGNVLESAEMFRGPSLIVFCQANQSNDSVSCVSWWKTRATLGQLVLGSDCDGVRRQHLDGVPSSPGIAVLNPPSPDHDVPNRFYFAVNRLCCDCGSDGAHPWSRLDRASR